MRCNSTANALELHLFCINSFDTGDVIYQLWGSIKSPVHQQAWHWLWWHVLLFQSSFHVFGSSQIQDTIQNGNMSFVISKTIYYVQSQQLILISNILTHLSESTSMEGPPVGTAFVLHTDISTLCDSMYSPHFADVLQGWGRKSTLVLNLF